MKRILSLIMAVLLLSTLFAGCSGGTRSDSGKSSDTAAPSPAGGEKVEVTYPMKGGVTLSFSAPENTNITAVSKWVDTPFIKAWQEQTGVTLKISHPADFSLLLASGDYPDIINNNWSAYAGGIAKAIDDGVIIAINSYTDYAPDYMKALKSNPDFEKAVKTPKGDIAGFYNLRTLPAQNSFGLIIRQDWLDKLKMDVPTTMDEFYNVLVAFKEKMGAKAPLSVTLANLRGFGTNGLVTSAFGLASTGYYHVDGKVHYGYVEKEYKDVLQWLNRLYKEGLLDNNVLTVNDATQNSNLMNGISGVISSYAGSGIGTLMTNMSKVNTEFALSGMGSLVKNKGERAKFGQRSDPATLPTVITSKCKDVKSAIQFLNYGYSEKGNLLLYYGLEGTSFEMKNNYPYYTDFAKKNPNGWSFSQAISQYAYSPQNGPYISNGDFSAQTYSPAQLNALKTWQNNDVTKHYIPTMVIALNDADEYAKITSEVNTYVNEQFALFVTGARPLSEFDAYLKTLQGMKVARMIQIYQNAFDVFNK